MNTTVITYQAGFGPVQWPWVPDLFCCSYKASSLTSTLPPSHHCYRLSLFRAFLYHGLTVVQFVTIFTSIRFVNTRISAGPGYYLSWLSFIPLETLSFSQAWWSQMTPTRKLSSLQQRHFAVLVASYSTRMVNVLRTSLDAVITSRVRCGRTNHHSDCAWTKLRQMKSSGLACCKLWCLVSSQLTAWVWSPTPCFGLTPTPLVHKQEKGLFVVVNGK